MRGILIVSHGSMAQGMLSSLEMLCGAQSDVIALGLDHDDSVESFTRRLLELEPRLSGYSQVLVLADLVGGSPCKAAFFAFCERENCRIIGGVNLGLLMEAVDENMEIDDLIAIGKAAICEAGGGRLGEELEIDE